jgi:hypothetical protein
MPQVESNTSDLMWWLTAGMHWVKSPSGYIYKVFMKHQWILCLSLGPIANILKSENNPKFNMHPGLKHLG